MVFVFGALAPVAVAAPAGAAGHPVLATGTVHCTISGAVKFAPGAKTIRQPKKAVLKATLSNCTGANEGAMSGGTLTAKVKPENFLPETQCPDLSAALVATYDHVMTWSNPKGAQRFAKTVAPNGMRETHDDTGGVLSESLDGKTGGPGSFFGSALSLHVVFDPSAAELADGCASKRGVTAIPFTGAHGASTLDIAPSSDPLCNRVIVDQKRGSDENVVHDGDCTKPLKTVTKALTLVGVEGDVTVEPGTYDAAHGEVFPLVGAGDVTIHGDYNKYKHLRETRGMTPLTKIVGDVQFVTDTLVGPGTLDDIAVDGKVSADGTLVAATTLTNSGGECLRGAAFLVGSNVTHCQTGVHLDHGGSVLLANTLSASGVNLAVDGTASVRMNWAAFGGAGDPAPNTLSCATAVNLVAGVDIDAGNNNWDHVPPTQSFAPTPRVDIFKGPGVTVSTAGAALATPNCP